MPRLLHADYASRSAWLADWSAGRAEWEGCHAGDVAFVLEALGVSPEDFERVLAQADAVRGICAPAALTDACSDYRIGLAHATEVSRYSGHPIGRYRDCVVLVWAKTEDQLRPPWRGRRR